MRAIGGEQIDQVGQPHVAVLGDQSRDGVEAATAALLAFDGQASSSRSNKVREPSRGI